MRKVLDLKISDEVIDSLSKNRCVNRVHLVGRIATRPDLTSMSRSLNKTTFSMVMAETWTRRGSGDRMHHLNVVDVEVLGQDSDRASEFEVGAWVVVDGYIRTESFGQRKTTSVRTYSIRSWDEDTGDHHGEREKRCPDGSEGVPREGRPRRVEVVGKGARGVRKPNSRSSKQSDEGKLGL